MPCRNINSPITGEELQSKTWSDIYNFVKDEGKADQLYQQLLSPEFISWFGDWVNSPETASKVVTEDGEPLVVYHNSKVEINVFEKEKAVGGFYFTPNKNSSYSKTVGSVQHPSFLNIKNMEEDDSGMSGEIDRSVIDNLVTPRGVDGIYGSLNNEYVVFEPNQIKSVFNNGQFSSNNEDIYFQTDNKNTIPSKAGNITLSQTEEFLKRNNIDIRELGKSSGLNGKAVISPLSSFVEYVAGQKETVLPEEAMHIAVSMLKQSSPKLYTDMLGKISQYNLYREVYQQYKDKYLTKEGKPDIRKIKEEAIAKLLVEFVINKNEGLNEHPENMLYTQSWWEKIVDWFKNLFSKGYNPFREAADKAFAQTAPGESMPKVILPIGTSGSGKSTWIKSLPKNKYTVISPDEMRVEFTGDMNDKSKDKEIYEEVKNRTINAINKGKQVIIDSTNLQKERRRDFISAIKAVIPNAVIEYKLMPLNPELAKQRIKADVEKGVDRAAVPDSTIDRHAILYNEMLEDIKEEPISPYNPQEDTDSNTFYQLSEDQKTKQLDLSRRLDEQLSKYGVNKIVKEATHPDEKDINKYVRTVEGKEQELARVTDIVDSKKDPKFKAKIANATKEEKAVYKLQAEWGTKFHADTEHIILNAALDNEGYLKPIEQIDLNGIVPTTNDDFFDAIQQFLLGTKEVPGYLYSQFPAGTLFKVEQQVFDPNRSFEGKKGLAGTIDLMGITPEGKVIIRDWKTMFLDLKTKDDVPYYKVKDTALQLGEYKKILSRAYDVDYSNISAQGQPVVYEGNIDRKKGTVNPTAIILPGDIRTETRKFVLPITTKDEKTGNEALDQFIGGLYQLHEHLVKKQTDEKELKNEQLNAIAATIRDLQIRQNFQPVANEARIFLKGADRLIADVEKDVKGKDIVEPKLFDTLLEEAITILDNIDKYTNLYSMFEDIYGKDTLTDEQKATREALKDLAAESISKKEGVVGSFRTLMDYLGKTKGVDHLLDTERNIEGFINRDVQSTSKLQTYAIQLFYKLESEAKTKRDVAIQDKIHQFEPVLEEYTTYAKSRGLSGKDYFSLIQAKDKDGKAYNKLLKKIKTEVYTLLEQATNPGTFDAAFIKNNIDVPAYEAYLKEKLQWRLDAVDREDYPNLTDAEKNTQSLAKKKQLMADYDTSKENSLGWYRYSDMVKFLLEDKWYTEEYKTIKDTPALIKMYNFIEGLNLQARETGYHENNFRFSKRFLPWINDRNPSKFTDFFTNLFKIKEDEEAYYGKIDPTTGQLEKSIPRPFIREIVGENGETPDLSTDIGLNITSYIKSVLNYQYMSEIEDKAKAIQLLEKAKKHYEVDAKGRIIKDKNDNFEELPGNEQNSRLLSQQIDGLLYNIQYDPGSGLGSPEATKAIEKLNNYMRLKVFALNVITPFVNTAGGNLQGTINSGKLWGGRQWLKNEMKMIANGFKGKEGNIEKGLIDYFIPLTEDINSHHAKQLSSEFLNKYTLQSTLLSPLRKSDLVVQHATALSMIENTALIEGKLVNVRQYISEQDRLTKYSLPEEERKKLEKTYKQRVEEFISTDSRMISKIAAFDSHNILTIPGLSRSSEEFARYRSKIQNEIKNITGGMTEDEKRNMERNILLRSMLMFKGWIPRMLDVRAGQIKKNASTDEYEIGRTRVWLSVLLKGTDPSGRQGNIFKGVIQGMKDLHDMRAANENGIKLLSQYYHRVADQYYQRTGKKLEMTKEAFYDMTRQAITMQVKDNLMLLSLLGLYFLAAGINPPDDPMEKNWRNTMVRVLDKLHDEVSFYYNPLSFQQIANGSLMPSIGILTDGITILKNISKETLGDEGDKTHTAKSILRTIPIFNQATSTILPLLDPETAKEFGYHVASQSGITR